MTAPKSAKDRAEAYAYSADGLEAYPSSQYEGRLAAAWLAGHAAGLEDARELVRAIENYFKAPLMDHSAALVASDCLRSALLDFKELAGEM